MRNIIILCTILLIAIAILASKYFTALAGKNNNLTKVLNYIPADAALILHFNNDESFYEIFKEYPLFDAIIGKERKKEISGLKDLITQSALTEFTSDKRVFLSLHPNRDSIDFLYSINLDQDYSIEDLKEVFSEVENLALKPLNNDLYELKYGDLKKPVYLFLQQGVAIASFSEILIKRCINEKEAHLSKLVTDEINKASGQNLNSPISLVINHEVIAPFLMHFMTGEAEGNSSLLTNLKGVSSLSMNYKSDALMLNGISTIDTVATNYLNIFRRQKPVPNTIRNVIPDNISSFLAFGLFDVSRFHQDLKGLLNSRKELQKLENQLSLIQEKTGLDLNREIKPLWDKEFVSVENAYGDRLAILKVTNGREINFKLQQISRPVNETISLLNYSHIFYYYFGDPLKTFIRPYYAVIDNYLIVANTPGIISNFLADYNQDRFLSHTNEFKQYDQLVANQSNILYFINLKNAKRMIRSSLKSRYTQAFAKEDSELRKFYGLSYQWAAEGGHFFSNFYLSYNYADSIALKR